MILRISPVGKAPVLGTGCRGFKSLHSDHPALSSNWSGHDSFTVVIRVRLSVASPSLFEVKFMVISKSAQKVLNKVDKPTATRLNKALNNIQNNTEYMNP